MRSYDARSSVEVLREPASRIGSRSERLERVGILLDILVSVVEKAVERIHDHCLRITG